MKLTDLEPQWIKIQPENGNALYKADGIMDADGIMFLCPKCYKANKGPVGTHRIICWRPKVSQDVRPTPGRWNMIGKGLDDLTLKAHSSSIFLNGPGCKAHFFIKNGIVMMVAD